MKQTAVVLTALEVEFTAVANHLTGARWQEHHSGTRFYVGDYHDWSIALIEIGRGNEEAAHSTERALEYFRPSIAMFVGVAGGVKDVARGDVVFGNEVHGYDYGKETGGVFLPRGQVAVSSFKLVAAARQLRHELRDEIDYSVVIEPIAAGGKISADDEAATAKLIKDHYSQVVAVETEGLGFLKAGYARSDVATGVVRGISDMRVGKSQSDADGWQDTAARNAAHFTLRLLDLMHTAEPASIDTVGEHMLAAWLRLRGWPDDPTSNITDRLSRRRTQRLLDELQDLLVERLQPLAPNATACQAAVTGLLEFTRDPPHKVDIGTVSSRLSPEGSLDQFVSDVSALLVEAYLALPELKPDMATGLHDRAAELRKRLEQALVSMPNRVTRTGEGVAESTYRTDYLRAVGHQLDTLQILGIDLVRAVERYSLTTAYVSLAAGSDHDVANVLATSQRLLLVGEAGSGKTTLLQWIAVTLARDQLPPQLTHWANKVPLLVRLRRYVHEPLPDADDFATEVATTLASRKPAHWCSNILVSGEAIVLIDGLDELPATRRPAVQAWLDDLMAACPDNTYVITSRPAALRDNSFKLAAFDAASLLPMGPPQITAFVRHWHESTGRNLPAEELDDHRAKGALLGKHILTTPALLDLARTPLLCAVLCALAYARKGVGSLPRRRVELYKAALDMLTGRRDSERRITASPLDSTERMALLESLAQWLIRNGESEIPKDKALRHIERTLRALRLSISAEDALRDLIERSVLREPATDVLDFAHRTFEEYLAARWMNDQGDIGALLDKAGDPAFNEVIVLAAGLARPKEAEELINKLIDKSKRSDNALYALAANCVDTCLRVEPETVSRLQQYYATLVPPANSDDVLLLTTGGDLSVVLLERFLSESNAATKVVGMERSVRTLGRIGSPEALRVLEELPDGLRKRLVQVLAETWSHFQPGEYAQRVLRPLGTQVAVTLYDTTRVPFTRLLPPDYLVRLALDDFTWAPNETVHFGNARLHYAELDLTLTEQGLASLAEVEGITGISVGVVLEEGLPQFEAQPTLTALALRIGSDQFDELDCRIFLAFPNLTELQLNAYEMRLVNLNALSRLKNLRLLELRGQLELTDVQLELPELRTLTLSEWTNENFTALAGCPAIEFLRITGSDDIVSLDGLNELVQLRSINLAGSTSLTDVTGLSGLQFIEDVDLTGCTGLDNHAHYVIDELPAGVEVELSGSRLDFDFSNVELQTRTTDTVDLWADTAHILQPADLEEAIDDFFIRSVVGSHVEADDYHNGWLVGSLKDIEYPSSEEAMANQVTPEQG
ncbi:hypothetical protein ALI144C_12595 [Actinosynnema sp. ALI-1.44]|uniref:phosphorylase family protein n=1 Tax=Actinosynnema sp. ALI-1.44 TaxID=1933779 RepID=UPI00097C5F65|nr:NACHT domain-containing protein [Actinosynnema sp. ALI-1.44]ONI85936.1 hypothetical protein ALI144C_12595 [Actinosynnema sp. ALI-1.44]